jgi:hypothetical protein
MSNRNEKSICKWKFLAGTVGEEEYKGSFDCVSASLREADTSLRMTKLKLRTAFRAARLIFRAETKAASVIVEAGALGCGRGLHALGRLFD